jgi:hypothetical protein
MSQKLETKTKGTLLIERSWISQGVGHIAELSAGGFIHVGGVPIKTEKEIRDIIPAGEDRTRALEWFKNKDKVAKEGPKRKILIEANGELRFDNGDPVTSVSDLINNIPTGPFLDAAVKQLAINENKKDASAARTQGSIKKGLDKIKQAEDILHELPAEPETEPD